MQLKIKSVSAIIESASIFVFAILLINATGSVSFLERHSALIIPSVFLYLSVLVSFIFRRDAKEYGFTLEGWSGDLLYVAIFMLIFFPAVYGAYWVYRQFYHPAVFHFRLPDKFWLLMFYHILVVGLSEEAFFRGYLQRRLSDGIEGNCLELLKIKISWALLIANILFTLTHIIVLGQFWRINVFLPGLAFGWLREQRKSLVAPVLFHGLSNVFMKVLEASF